MGQSFAAPALFVATDLDSFETVEPDVYADDVTISGRCYRRLDPPYYAWLRRQMASAKRALDARRLSADAFETIRSSPCVAATREARHCIVGLLLGVACCSAGDCALCRATKDRMRRDGFSDVAIARSLARTRRGLLERCPTCGFPPPPAIGILPQLPRLDRGVAPKSISAACCICGDPLPRGRRRCCTPRCRQEYLRRYRETRRAAPLNECSAVPA